MPEDDRNPIDAKAGDTNEIPAGELDGLDGLAKQLAELHVVRNETLQQLRRTVSDTTPLLGVLEQTGNITPYQREVISGGKIAFLRFDDYLILDHLGGGGMGEVYKARNLELERIEAIKMIRSEIGNERVVQRLKREAIALAQLEHPCIVPVYKVGTVHNAGYIAMKFVAGEDLKQRVSRLQEEGEHLDVATACRWIRNIADALDHAHQRGIIHRDVKPSNLMIDGHDNIIMLDLGIARLIDPDFNMGQGLTQARHALGTPQYMPPEQWADASEASAASDIYSLGCTLYFALTGSPPFIGNSSLELMRAHNFKPLPFVSDVRVDVPVELDQVLAKATAKEPSERYHTAREFADALEVFTQNNSASLSAVRIERDVSAPPAPRRVSPLTLAGVLTAVVLGITSTWWVLHQGSDIQMTPMEQVAKTRDTGIRTGESDTTASQPSETPTVPGTVSPSREPTVPKPIEPLPDWLEQFARKNRDVWPDDNELFTEAKSRVGDSPLSEKILDPAGSLVVETSARRRRLFESKAINWLASYQEQNPFFWPDSQELQQFANNVTPLTEIDDSEELATIQDAVQAETARFADPLAPMNPGVVPRSWESAALPALQQILAVQSGTRDPNWKLDVHFVDSDKRKVESAGLGQEVLLRITSSRDGFITLVQFDDVDLMVAPFTQQFSAGKPLTLDEPAFAFDTPATKRFFVYATDKPFISEIVFPLRNESPLIQQWFENPRVHKRMEQALVTGQPYPGIAASHATERWTHSVVRLKVE